MARYNGNNLRLTSYNCNTCGSVQNVRSASMAIHSGLSVTIVGHLIQLDRDEQCKVAKVVVSVISGHTVTGLETEAIKAASDLLVSRAKRFLGLDWTVVGWDSKMGVAERSA